MTAGPSIDMSGWLHEQLDQASSDLQVSAVGFEPTAHLGGQFSQVRAVPPAHVPLCIPESPTPTGAPMVRSPVAPSTSGNARRRRAATAAARQTRSHHLRAHTTQTSPPACGNAQTPATEHTQCALPLDFPARPGQIIRPLTCSGRSRVRTYGLSLVRLRRHRGIGRAGCPDRRGPSHTGVRCGRARCCMYGTGVPECTLRTIGSSPGSTRDHGPRG
jgi:hypothetical protein